MEQVKAWKCLAFLCFVEKRLFGNIFTLKCNSYADLKLLAYTGVLTSTFYDELYLGDKGKHIPTCPTTGVGGRSVVLVVAGSPHRTLGRLKQLSVLNEPNPTNVAPNHVFTWNVFFLYYKFVRWQSNIETGSAQNVKV